MYIREGDFIETKDNLFFDVKGYDHPRNRIIAFLRYYPDRRGDRIKNYQKYQKVYSLNKRYDILKTQFPHYLYKDETINQIIQAIPINYIKKIYYPHEYLERILKKKKTNDYEKQVLEFVSFFIKYVKIFVYDIGVSGSPMIGLNKYDSDIDLIIYGKNNALKVYNALDMLFDAKDIPITRYTENELKGLYDFKSKDTDISWEKFYEFEKKKKTQGKFKDTDFFIRFVKAWDDIEGDNRFKYGYFSYKTIGKATIEAKITNDDEFCFTPCCYEINNIKYKDIKIFGEKSQRDIEKVKINEIVSYRGRFTEARKNEIVHARGNIELVKGKNKEEYLRLIVGNEKEDFLYT
ncbi:MAG: hypothetical protein EAX96_04440 [Candidatus Lokiarchaeota archaeon]|nr:hypothetical protein [Candidatus Lokiarchaeota archaeon]